MITRAKRTVGVGAVCVLALVAASCGDDDDPSTAPTAAETSAGGTTAASAASTTASSTGTTAARATTSAGTATTAGGTATTAGPAGEPTGTPVKVGLLYAETGRTGGTYNSVDEVAESWAEWVNTEQGGVNGHPVEVVAADDLSTGEGATAAARELVEGEGVVAVVIQDSVGESATVEYLSTQGVPFIGGTNNGRPVDGRGTPWPNTHFVTSASSPASSASPILASKAVGQSTFSSVVCAEVPACAEAGALYEPVANALALDYVGLVTVAASEPSYTAPCLELIGKGADYINLGVSATTALAVVDECNNQGFEGVWGATNNTVVAKDFEGIEGMRLAAGMHGFPWYADAEPAQNFRDATEDVGVDVRNPSATSTWSALELFRKAMTDYGPAADATITSADVIAAYRQVKGETLDGLLASPLTFVADGPQPLVPCFWLVDMQDGEFSTITLGESGNGVTGDLQSSCFEA